jgi:hypothetical protein
MVATTLPQISDAQLLLPRQRRQPLTRGTRNSVAINAKLGSIRGKGGSFSHEGSIDFDGRIQPFRSGAAHEHPNADRAEQRCGPDGFECHADHREED